MLSRIGIDHGLTYLLGYCKWQSDLDCTRCDTATHQPSMASVAFECQVFLPQSNYPSFKNRREVKHLGRSVFSIGLRLRFIERQKEISRTEYIEILTLICILFYKLLRPNLFFSLCVHIMRARTFT